MGPWEWPIRATIAATGGATPYSWSILGFTGANSYSINSVTGVLTGTLGVAEIDSINIQVVDALGIPSAKNFNLTVIPAASLTITTTSPLPAATQSSAYSTTTGRHGRERRPIPGPSPVIPAPTPGAYRAVVW